MSYGVIYLITNLVNGKKYVGQTTQENPMKRIINHRYTNYPIGRAMRKYGYENFSIDYIHECDSLEELNECERKSISEYNSLIPNGYNITEGGSNGWKMTDEFKAEWYKNRADTSGENHPLWGKSHSEIAKKRMSEAKMGENNPNWGKTRNESTKRKISKANKGKKRSEEARKRMSLIQKERFKNEKPSNIRSVINVDTLEVFESATDGANHYSLQCSNLIRNCKGRSKTCGGYHWMYYEDYLEQQNNNDTKAS